MKRRDAQRQNVKVHQFIFMAKNHPRIVAHKIRLKINFLSNGKTGASKVWNTRIFVRGTFIDIFFIEKRNMFFPYGIVASITV